MGVYEDGLMGNEEDMLENTEEVTVTLQEILQVFEHGVGDDGESHRFYSREKEAGGKYKVSIIIDFHRYATSYIYLFNTHLQGFFCLSRGHPGPRAAIGGGGEPSPL